MKALIQRVTAASVTVDGELISSIGRGLCILIGISRYDTDKDLDYISRKVLSLRLFEDGEKRWTKNVMEKNLEILCVSQFTLYSVLKGNKLDFHNAMAADSSKQLYEKFLSQLRSSYKPEAIKDGLFGAYMQIDIRNDGPVTYQLESPQTAK
ncbi:D-tyrosyl-tRNA(Tyr) deacylase 1 [Trichoplax sp. H2]|uniref:D-aminoacyl-tRNA deacylase n=1 Tax=Trichoplax adhaerens TaxID=10228 RepID=B3RKW5_TRIAD|nr:hypothetical protein TRIADDRAFT_19862 [Trichoplax adhaerens]EDV29445.1 hypothetical protein TRIADDRAFT_19862 [Trichoplax adhaerens]RDD38503.1 D-tyrosyl-tRNA(Tyr) deacylase 1 [Trichoplax sp. H2]|eukprot:XP_002108647.1 hypothetical protein TRIADDRAFT_19862 [Trichoplax adhaerens]